MRLMIKPTFVRRLGLLGAAALFSISLLAQGIPVKPARPDAYAARSMMLDTARAGKRLIAVGEQGHVMLSDDGGQSSRQARSVPVDFTLTAVSFVDERNGWAVGHGGVILHTDDGGENWKVQRIDVTVDQPLFSVYFRDAKTGWAAGLWSLLLATTDGGQSWTQVKLDPASGQKRADLNLLKIFPGRDKEIYIAAEQGILLRSADGDGSWRYITTGSTASLWAGALAPDNAIVVGGLRGKMLRSADGGASWQSVNSNTNASITKIAAQGGAMWASSLDGKLIRSIDDGKSWTVAQDTPVSLTTIGLTGEHDVQVYSKQGRVSMPVQDVASVHK